MIEISVLGPLHVVRQDGTVVAVEEWRTGRTRDLLRLLALADGHPVRTSALMERLWPDVPDDRRRNRLRTATYQIRHTLGPACVTRQVDGLVLESAWVDAVQFRLHARQVHEAARDGRHEHVVALAEQAEGLYRGDFQAYDDDALWARSARQDLLGVRQAMLCEAVESALALHLSRAGLDLATRAVRVDPTSEGAQRALMRAHAELGEIGSALRAFETFRASLADELGADPSPETRELHLRLLREQTV